MLNWLIVLLCRMIALIPAVPAVGVALSDVGVILYPLLQTTGEGRTGRAVREWRNVGVRLVWVTVPRASTAWDARLRATVGVAGIVRAGPGRAPVP
jgi:hypothetical protein